MKALLDMPVSPKLASVLRSHGHEGVHASRIGMAKASDRELLGLAREEGRVIVTADLDFPRLLALSASRGPGLILFRGGEYSDEEMCELLDRVLCEMKVEEIEHSISVVDKRRIRVTRLPLGEHT